MSCVCQGWGCRVPGSDDVSQERKKRGRATGDVRTRILDAAASVFGAKGYARATTRSIAQVAGVAEGTVFNYFDTKEAVMTALVEREIVESIPQLLVPGESFAEALTRLLRNRMELFHRSSGVIKAMLAEALFNPEIADRLRTHVFRKGFAELTSFLRGAMERGDIRACPPELAARVILAMVIGQAIVLELVVPAKSGADVDLLVEQMVSTVVNGLEAHPGD